MTHATRTGPPPSPLRHRPELRPLQEIYETSPDGNSSTSRRRSRHSAVVGAAFATASVVVGTVVAAIGDHDDSPPQVVSAPPLAAPSAPVGFAEGGQCPSVDTATVVQGNGPGGTDTGAHAILGFDHAYYVLRDAAGARSFVAPNSTVNPVDKLQAGIGTVPEGTEHCLLINADGPDRHRVELTTRHRRGGDARTYRQIVTMVTVAGRVLIAAIADAPQ